MQFSIYYHSPKNGEYLCRVVMAAAGISQVADIGKLLALGKESGSDVVLVEYQDNNPELDNWIIPNAGDPQSPDIFLFVEEESPSIIWKAVKLGVQEIFCRTIPPADFQEALARVEDRSSLDGENQVRARLRNSIPTKNLPGSGYRTDWLIARMGLRGGI
jgi:AmiR/NasT family two-component response regulator